MTTRRRCAALVVFSAMFAAAQTAPEGILVGPVSYTTPVMGVPVTAQARSYLSINTSGSGINVGLDATVNLADLQRQFPAIIETIPLPRENCKSFSPNNPVVSLRGQGLEYSSGQAIFKVAGSVTMWECLENPIPEVYWDPTGCSAFGIGKFGCPKTRRGSPIKTKLITQPFEASLPVSVAPTSATTVGVTIGAPSIELKGQYAFISKGILNIAGVNINDYAKQAIDKAINPSSLQLGVPEDYTKLNPTITAARFVETEGALGLNLAMTAQVSQASANDFVNLLVKSLPTGK